MGLYQAIWGSVSCLWSGIEPTSLQSTDNLLTYTECTDVYAFLFLSPSCSEITGRNPPHEHERGKRFNLPPHLYLLPD